MKSNLQAFGTSLVNAGAWARTRTKALLKTPGAYYLGKAVCIVAAPASVYPLVHVVTSALKSGADASLTCVPNWGVKHLLPIVQNPTYFDTTRQTNGCWEKTGAFLELGAMTLASAALTVYLVRKTGIVSAGREKLHQLMPTVFGPTSARRGQPQPSNCSVQ